MRYVVVGAGAIGGTIGARLYGAGFEVLLVARGQHLDAIRAEGLRFDEPGRSQNLQIPVVGHVGEAAWRDGDVAVMCTKSQDTQEVLDQLRLAAPDVPVVCAQNGVANERLAAARFEQVLGICVMLPAEHLEPGRVAAFSAPVPGILDIGVFPAGAGPLSNRIAGDLGAAGFSSRAVEAVMAWKYSKLLGNLGNAAEAACGFDDPDLGSVYGIARAEGERCLAAAGIVFTSPEVERRRRGDLISVQPIDGRARRGSSTWQSLARRVGTVETDFLNGEVVKLGLAHGVATPMNALLLDTTRSMAAGMEPAGSRRCADLLMQVNACRAGQCE
jgi:2-dehydropantoate 2-reductase